MENENYLIRADDNIFKVDYSEQKMDINLEFLKWKESMLEKYGSNAKLFHCIKDKIYFYVSKKECNYMKNCPLCNNNICYFCKSNGYHDGYCCISYKFYSMFFVDSSTYFEQYGGYRREYCQNKLSFDMVIQLIPILNIIYTIGSIHSCFYYSLDKYKGLKSNRNQYYQWLEDEHIISLYVLVGFDIGFSFLIVIPFWSYIIFYTIVLDLSSLLLDFYPIKIIAGILFNSI